ncbi:MAG: hypothetical protein ACLQFR_02875 [Streptosporangiaceae bacterium]
MTGAASNDSASVRSATRAISFSYSFEPLCRRHHRAKQAPGWHLEHREPGRMTWRLPSGRVYETTGDHY